MAVNDRTGMIIRCGIDRRATVDVRLPIDRTHYDSACYAIRRQCNAGDNSANRGNPPYYPGVCIRNARQRKTAMLMMTSMAQISSVSFGSSHFPRSTITASSLSSERIASRLRIIPSVPISHIFHSAAKTAC